MEPAHPQPPITISSLFREAGKLLRSEFERIRATNPHYGERGRETESILASFLSNHLPKRWDAGTGIVIDTANSISRQSDVLVYDAHNSPVYRRGPGVLILPSDNVGAVIEVKSRLDKAELEDALEKVASVKRLRKSRVAAFERDPAGSVPTMTTTLGIVFAYQAATSLETLAENMASANASRPTQEWADMVAVLDEGVIGYMMQMPFGGGVSGFAGGSCDPDFAIPPWYVHLVIEKLGDLTLNRMFLRLMHHLAFYRTRSGLSQETMLGSSTTQALTIQAYQYTVERQLKPTTPDHAKGTFKGPTRRFNLFTKKPKRYVGQIGWFSWQDGAVVSYSGHIPPAIVYSAFASVLGPKPVLVPGNPEKEIWLSTVCRMASDQFETLVSAIGGDFSAHADDTPEGRLPFLPEDDLSEPSPSAR